MPPVSTIKKTIMNQTFIKESPSYSGRILKILSDQNSIMGIKKMSVKYENGPSGIAVLKEGERIHILYIINQTKLGKIRILNNGKNVS